MQKLKRVLSTLMPGPFSQRSGLLTGRGFYKPFSYPEFYDRWDTHERMHWLPSEVPMHDDVKDWNTKLTENERNFLTNVFRFFTQGDIDVAGGYYADMIPTFCKTPEIAMFLGSIAAREGVHIDAYSHLIETLSMPETTYIEFLQYNEMRDKQTYVKKFQNAFTARYDVPIAAAFALTVTTLLLLIVGPLWATILGTILVINITNRMSTRHLEHVAAGMALFSGFTEGMQLFSSFAMLLAFSKTGVMRGMGDIVQWSVTDETMHTRGMISLFRIFVDENSDVTGDFLVRTFGQRVCHILLGPRGIRLPVLETTVKNIAREMVSLEDKFIDLTFDSYGKGSETFKGLRRQQLKDFIRFLADIRLRDMRFTGRYPHITTNPMPEFESMLNAPVITNFFEQRSTDYALPMNYRWGSVWGNRHILETALHVGDADAALQGKIQQLTAHTTSG